jgi:hypothetical protein
VEYGRVKKLESDVHSVGVLELPARADSWGKRGLSVFVLDSCARCGDANLAPLETLRSPERLGYLWAATLLLREERMRQFAGRAFQSLLHRQVDGIIPKLKEMRDHIDPGCAVVHHTLALLHLLEVSSQGQELLAFSKERLAELGYGALARDVPDGVDGLMRGFSQLRAMAEGNFAAMPSGQSTAAQAGSA